MNVSIINIGDELLIGQVINTNSSWMAQQLNLKGFSVDNILVVGDSGIEIKNAIDFAFSRSNIVLITGGLGPTNDDVTKKVLCEYFNDKLILDNIVLENIKRIFDIRRYPLTPVNIKQAEVPEKAIVFNNNVGTAPGILLSINNKIAISLPGVPFEMKELMLTGVLPYLKDKFTVNKIIHKTILTQGIGESALAEKIGEWESNLPNYISLAYLPSPGLVRLRLSAINHHHINIEKIIDLEIIKLCNFIDEYIFGYDDDTLEEIIGKILIKNAKSIAIAESCTGGSIAQYITKVAGCSKYFKGSVTAYSNEIKMNLLNVEEDSIKYFGAVSEQVALQMAIGVRNLMNSDFSIATTGIAGPDGGSIEKPIGTTWIAVASKDNAIAQKFTFGDDRNRNILRATMSGLNLFRKFIIQNL